MTANIDDFGKGIIERKRESRTKTINAPPLLANDDCIEDEQDKESKALKKTQWAIVGYNSYMPCATTIAQFESGVYSIVGTQNGILFHKDELNTDDLIDFPDSVFSKVINEVNSFWKLKDKFDKYGFLHRRGYIIYGPAGGGKTCLVKRIMQNVIANGGVVFMGDTNPRLVSDGIKLFREIESKRQILCVFEDIDAIISNYGDSSMLSLLDGENMCNGIINIATTNYPEHLDQRIIARPRRFDQIIKVEAPTAEMRKIYFVEKLKFNGNHVDKWVEKTEGLSFAALAEMVIAVKCLGNDFDETLEKLRSMRGKESSSEFRESGMGFKMEKTVGIGGGTCKR